MLIKMLGYIIVVLVFLIYIFVQIIANSSIFGQLTHKRYRELIKILISREYGMTDRYDDGREFIKSEQLSDSELNKLFTFIKIQRERFTNSFPIYTLLATILITLVTILIGATLSSTLGGLFGTLSNNLYDKKYEVAKVIYDDLMSLVDKASTSILLVFIFGITVLASWWSYAKYRTEVNLGAQKIVEEELNDRLEEKKLLKDTK